MNRTSVNTEYPRYTNSRRVISSGDCIQVIVVNRHTFDVGRYRERVHVNLISHSGESTASPAPDDTCLRQSAAQTRQNRLGK